MARCHVCQCQNITPHDLAADVRVFGEDAKSGAFCSLELKVGDHTITVLLPAHAYQGARDVADMWPQLVDRGRTPRPTHERLPPFEVGASS